MKKSKSKYQKGDKFTHSRCPGVVFEIKRIRTYNGKISGRFTVFYFQPNPWFDKMIGNLDSFEPVYTIEGFEV